MSQFLASGQFVTSDVRFSTERSVLQNMRVHIEPAWGDVPASDITHGDVQAWVNRLNAELAPSTVRNIVNHFRRVVRQMISSGILDGDPSRDVILPAQVFEEQRFLNTAEIAALTDAMNFRFRAFVPLCAYGGLRIGEAFGLTWDDVDLFNGKIEIRRTATEINGHVRVGPPKTKTSRRTILVPRVVVYALRDHGNAVAARPGADRLVFPGVAGDHQRSTSFRRHSWTLAVDRAGLAPLTPHDLRHTAVSMWIAAGWSPKQVAATAGHSSVAFCLDRYGHLFPSGYETANRQLESLIARGVK